MAGSALSNPGLAEPGTVLEISGRRRGLAQVISPRHSSLGIEVDHHALNRILDSDIVRALAETEVSLPYPVATLEVYGNFPASRDRVHRQLVIVLRSQVSRPRKNPWMARGNRLQARGYRGHA